MTQEQQIIPETIMGVMPRSTLFGKGAKMSKEKKNYIQQEDEEFVCPRCNQHFHALGCDYETWKPMQAKIAELESELAAYKVKGKFIILIPNLRDYEIPIVREKTRKFTKKLLKELERNRNHRN